MNNSMWVIEEFNEWLNKAYKTIKELYEKADDEEKGRLKEKYYTIKMVVEKFEQLKNQ